MAVASFPADRLGAKVPSPARLAFALHGLVAVAVLFVAARQGDADVTVLACPPGVADAFSWHRTSAMSASFLAVRFVAQHSVPSRLTDALEGQAAFAVDASRQGDALGAVGSGPAHFAGASVGPGTVAVLGARRVAHRLRAGLLLVRPPGQAVHVPLRVADVVVSFLDVLGNARHFEPFVDAGHQARA